MGRLRIGAPVGPLLLAVAGVQAVAALLFFVRAPVVVGLWPIPGTGEMTLILMASFFAASAASTAWAVLWGEPGSLVGIALDYVVIFVPLSVLAVTLEPARGGGSLPFIAATVGRRRGGRRDALVVMAPPAAGPAADARRRPGRVRGVPGRAAVRWR